MITKNSVNYTSLFEKATNLLKQYDGQDSDFRIDNIDEYFQHIKTLAAIENHDNENLTVHVPDDVYIDPIYTMLPLEEELFKIDANTREIKVPKHFSTYGVGVQGDEIAEILYFSIDRYFDAIDLADMEILIQWNRAGDNLSQNLDLTYKRSLEYRSGEIIFGWPVSSAMTEEPGDINFAIRFYRIDDNNKLWYSFSTKTATIKIQKGLDFELTKDSIAAADNYRNHIYDTLRNSSSPIKGYVIAEPEFIEYALRVNGENEFDDVVALNSDLPCSFRTRAHISNDSLDKGEKMGINGLKYEWWYKDKDVAAVKVNENVSNVYIPVTPATLLDNEYYYYKDENGEYKIYTNLSGQQDLYQKYSVLEPSRAGSYFAKAINTYNFNESAEGKSAEWTIPYPDSPTLLVEYSQNERLPYDSSITLTIDASENNDLIGVKEYKWYRDNAYLKSGDTSLTVEEEGNYYLEIINTRNQVSAAIKSNPIKVLYVPGEVIIEPVQNTAVEKTDDLVLAIVAKVRTNQKGDLTYQWEKKNGETWVNCTNGSSSAYAPSDTGKYRCKVICTYVGVSTDPSYSNEIDVYSV